VRGPRDRSFTAAALRTLVSRTYQVTPESDRVGARLAGPRLERAGPDAVPSEGVVLGAVQVPLSGRPVVFLADHPTTGGYPVVAVVHPDDLWRVAQSPPGTAIRFHWHPLPRTTVP
jgi:allophanate hydrolase subunit 2